jgi:two-component system invasion response regulator UvrY
MIGSPIINFIKSDVHFGSPPMKRVLIVDEHQLIRQGLKSILDEPRGGTIFGEASSALEAIRLAREQDWDIVTLALSLGEQSGLEVLKELKHIHPRLPILVLSRHREEQCVRRALKAGATGYVTKDSSCRELVKAVNNVIEGKLYVSPDLAEKAMADPRQGPVRPLHQTLSYREYEVMTLIASGKTIKEVATMLSLSDKTVSTYRTRILEKMQMKTSAELTHYAIQNRLVD